METTKTANGGEELTTNPRIHEIALRVERGESNISIIKEFTARWSAGERTIARYIAIAKKIVRERIGNEETITDVMRNRLIQEEDWKQSHSDDEIEKKLWAIADGEAEIVKKVNTVNGLEEMRCNPDFGNRLQAFDKICKLRGKYIASSAGNNASIQSVQIIVRNQKEKMLVENYIAFLHSKPLEAITSASDDNISSSVVPVAAGNSTDSPDRNEMPQSQIATSIVPETVPAAINSSASVPIATGTTDGLSQKNNEAAS
ncbi:MAG: hypothetical protein ACLQQ4_09350 [Bacteroidia bacterium]